MNRRHDRAAATTLTLRRHIDLGRATSAACRRA
jgi:hypothetical protein